MALNFAKLDHIIATVNMRSSLESGRSTATPGVFFSCLAGIDDLLVDCRLFLQHPMLPESTNEGIPIVFISAHNILSKVEIGDVLQLYEGHRVIGSAIVTKLMKTIIG